MLTTLLPLFLAASAATPEAVAKDFLTAYLKQSPSALNFKGAKALAPFLSTRLNTVLDDAASCQADWERQQPKGSTDKPPFVDCCLFASSPEGLPTSFALATPQALPDGRQRIAVTFTYVVLASEGGRFVVDDFLYERDTPGVGQALSKSFNGCRGPKWVGEK